MNILIIRLSAIGDIIMASPLAESLRQHYPDAKISWLVQPEGASLIADNPYVDEVIVWSRKTWQSLWQKRQYWQLIRTISAFRRDLRARQFTLALDAQGILKSGFLAYLSNAPQRIGLGSKEGSQWLMTQVISRNGGNTQRISSEYLWLLESLGLPYQGLDMKLGISTLSNQQAIQKRTALIGEQSYVAICPFTTRPQKHWFDDYWVELSEQIFQHFHCPTLILGGPADKETAEKLAENTPMVSLAGETSLQEAAAIIRDAALVIGVDTGLTHMGHVFKTPTLALFGSTCPYLETGLETSKVIYLDLHCSPCRRNPTCDGRFDCLKQITPAKVISEAKALLPQALVMGTTSA